MQRRLAAPRKGAVLVAMVTGLTGLAGCSFDVDGIGDATDASSAGDDRLVDPDAALPDAGPCPEPLRLVLAIDGVTVGEPRGDALVGDTVTLSAAGSCSQAGPLTYQWQVSPIDDTRGTAVPSLTAETLTIYPVLPRTYAVELTVDDGVTTDSVSASFVAHGFLEQPDAMGDIRDLDVGDDVLWVATRSGAFHSTNLAAPITFVALASEVFGVGEDALPAAFDALHYDDDDHALWLGDDTSAPGLYRVDYATLFPASDLVHYDGAIFGASAEANDVVGFGTGIAVATSRGATTAPGGLAPAFATPFVPAPTALFAVADRGTLWAGGELVHDIADAATLDPFDDSDNAVRAFAVDPIADELWVGSNDLGVARLDAAGTTIARYSEDNGDLPDDEIRAIAVEPGGRFTGDVWLTTSAGVARFKRDRGIWFTYGNTEGLMGNLNIRAVAVDYDEASGRRVIWGGTNRTLVYIRVP